MRKYTPEERIQKFWNKMDQSGGEDACWEWTASRDRKGYGEVRWENRQRRFAHRMAYELTFGINPAALEVCHKCDNPACCNPKHLFLGTHAENMDDMKQKGRSATVVRYGESNGSHKLSDAQVVDIRQRYEHGGVTQTELAREFGVHQTLISLIVKRKNRNGSS